MKQLWVMWIYLKPSLNVYSGSKTYEKHSYLSTYAFRCTFRKLCKYQGYLLQNVKRSNYILVLSILNSKFWGSIYSGWEGNGAGLRILLHWLIFNKILIQLFSRKLTALLAVWDGIDLDANCMLILRFFWWFEKLELAGYIKYVFTKLNTWINHVKIILVVHCYKKCGFIIISVTIKTRGKTCSKKTRFYVHCLVKHIKVKAKKYVHLNIIKQ